MAYHEFTVTGVPAVLSYEGCQSIARVEKQKTDLTWGSTGKMLGGPFKSIKLLEIGEYRVEIRRAGCCEEDPVFVLTEGESVTVDDCICDPCDRSTAFPFNFFTSVAGVIPEGALVYSIVSEEVGDPPVRHPYTVNGELTPGNEISNSSFVGRPLKAVTYAPTGGGLLHIKGEACVDLGIPEV